MKLRAACVLFCVAAFVMAGCVPADRYSETEPAGPARLVSYDSCDSALRELKDAARTQLDRAPEAGNARPGQDSAAVAQEAAPAAPAAPGPAAPAEGRSAQEHSTTNNHEAGVAEPDLVQTDGRRIVTVVDGRLRVLDPASRTITATLSLPSGTASQLLLDGDRALVISHDARVTMVDLAGGAKVVGSLNTEGRYVDARLVNGRARVVVSSTPKLPHARPHLEPAESLDRSTIDDWLPRYKLSTPTGSEGGRLVDCDRLYHPGTYTASSILTVLTFDMAGKLGNGDPVAVTADGGTVYGTAANLYVAHALPERTEIHQFDITGAGPARHVASGSVPGALLNQYSMSEYQGRLRVATHTGGDNTLTVLKRDGSGLVPVGKLGGLGKGERIYAVRFFGPVGYVVTFRETDPLYTLDLSDPAAPRAVGELKITGYSAYLHSVGPGRLIGVGQEADLRGRSLGLQVSLFDVANAARPHWIAQHQLSGGMARVETDTHAFLYWEPERLLVLPTGSAALVLRLTGDGFTELGWVGHGTPVLRSLVIGNELWTISASGAAVYQIDTLAQRAWVPFTS